MKPSRRALAAATAVLLGLAPLTLATASTASAETALPIAHFSHIVVDQAHGHLFISGGPGTSQIVVTDLDGTTITSIPVASSATGLALSPEGTTLYAALPDSDTITAIDTATLTQKASYPTGAGTRPDSLATVAGTLWFGYGTTGNGNIGSLATDGTITLSRDAQAWPTAPTLATTPSASNILVAAVEDPGTSTAPFSVYTASTDGLTRTAHASLPVSDLSDFAVTPDGKDIAVGSYANPTGNGRYRTSDLTPDGNYAIGLPGTTLAMAADATIATSDGTDCVFTEAADGTGTYNSYFTGAGRRVAPHGLAWAGDDSRLFEVSTDDAGNNPTLQVQTQPEVSPTHLSNGQPDTYAPGEPLSLHLGDSGGVPFHSGDLLTVTRFDADHPTGIAMPPLSMSAGWLGPVLHDTVPTHGPLSYRFDYAGDAHHTSATRTVTIPIAAYAPKLTLTGPAASIRGAALTVAGTLTWPHAHLSTGTVHIVRTDLAHPHGYSLGAVPVAADGSFTLRDTPTIGGVNTYALTYDGGTAYLPVTQTATVQVSRQATTLAVTTSGAVFNYGGWVHVTAHLGTTYNGRRVTLYAQPAGGTRTAFNSGIVDAHGNLSSWYKLSHNTVFSAAFGGDYRYAPATATSRIAYVHALVTDVMEGGITTTRIGGTTYAVYMRDAPQRQPLLDTIVAPDHSGQPLTVVLQRYYSGAWHTVSTRTTALKSYSAVYTDLPWASMPNYALYRVAAEYVHNAADTTNLDAWGNWAYFTVHPHP